MARSYQIACSPTTVTLIADSETLGGGPRVRISVPSTAAGGVYLAGEENQTSNPAEGGGTALSPTTGILVAAGEAIDLFLEGNEKIYGRAAISTATTSVHVFRTSGRFG
jgi:hypothetical protein